MIGVLNSSFKVCIPFKDTFSQRALHCLPLLLLFCSFLSLALLQMRLLFFQDTEIEIHFSFSFFHFVTGFTDQFTF